MDGMPKGINYANLREAVTPTSEPTVEQPMRVIHAHDLVKVGGLYRIRDNYEAIWRMESNEDGKRYIVRADAEGDTAPERLRVESTDRAENQPKAAAAVTADKCKQCGENIKEGYTHQRDYHSEKGYSNCKQVKAGVGNYDTRDKECAKCKGKCECKSAFKVIHAGAVYVAWECDDCATPNLTKFGTRTYECDECHRRFADGEVLRVEQPKQQTFTRAEVAEHSPEFAKRMGTLGISVVHASLLNVWEKEAEESDPADEPGKRLQHGGSKKCKGCDVKMPGSSVLSRCPRCIDKGKDAAKKVNPWAVCHSSVGPEKSEKFERCVQDVKKQD